MSRVLRLAGAQMGANQKADSREAILARMVALLEQAAAAGAKMVEIYKDQKFSDHAPVTVGYDWGG